MREADRLERLSLPTQSAIIQACQQSDLGKLLPGAFYIHESALRLIPETLRICEAIGRHHLHRTQSRNATEPPITLIKFNLDQPAISYLHYPDFFTDPHPALHASIKVQLQTGELSYRNYSQSPNPPILHRKETFLSPEHPRHAAFTQLTQQQQDLDLLKDTRTIGTRNGWRKRLASHHIEIIGDRLACPLAAQPSFPVSASARGQRTTSPPKAPLQAATAQSSPSHPPQIDRHRAAIHRNSLSKPVRLALEAGLLTPETSFFDYGCGHGGDSKRLSQKGFASSGWDPYYRPKQPHQAADIINLGYVINVIENQSERRQALLNAWALTQNVLIVAAQVLIDDRNRGLVAYEDGIITSRNTFQKYYEQEELKAYIDQVLASADEATATAPPASASIDAIPVALGIYFVFRDPTQAQAFRASRFRSRATTPRILTSVRRFEEYKELLTPLMAFYTERGRLPIGDEITDFTALTEQFGSLKRAFKLVFQATNSSEWDAISDKRRNDLIVYLALSQFDRRPKFRDLSPDLQHDVKGLFGSYQSACTAADLMLMSLGNLEMLAQRAQLSPIGHKRKNALFIHVNALSELDPLLRLYEGCASRTLGRPEEANVIKFSLHRPRIAYHYYPDFDRNPHPGLQMRMRIDLQDLQVRYSDYNLEDNHLILHQKDHLVTSDYPLYEKFAKLSKQEADWGLLDDLEGVGDRYRWLKHLTEHCAKLQGHRLVWQKDADPYKLKLLKSNIRARQKAYIYTQADADTRDKPD